MFNKVVSEADSIPKYLSTDNAPLFLFNRWKINLEMYGIEEIKSVPGVPSSHPVIERLVGTSRRECTNYMSLRSEHEFTRKFSNFVDYYGENRVHRTLSGMPPNQFARGTKVPKRPIPHKWKKYCGGSYELPVAA